MNQDKLQLLRDDLCNAVTRLGEAIAAQVSSTGIEVDASIQRFEFSFELAWKYMQAQLRYDGIETGSPRAAIKEAFASGMIAQGDAWIDMLEDRNRTSHTYDEDQATQIYDKIRQAHYPILQSFCEQITS